MVFFYSSTFYCHFVIDKLLKWFLKCFIFIYYLFIFFDITNSNNKLGPIFRELINFIDKFNFPRYSILI